MEDKVDKARMAETEGEGIEEREDTKREKVRVQETDSRK